MILTVGRLQSPTCGARTLEHAKHDGADKGEGHIGANNAQSADESHRKPPWFNIAARLTLEPGRAFPEKKRQRCCRSAITSARANRGNVVKES